jgi:hypothetical protein
MAKDIRIPAVFENILKDILIALGTLLLKLNMLVLKLGLAHIHYISIIAILIIS